jgi:hypothetical protein
MDGGRFDDTMKSRFQSRRGVLTGSAALTLAGSLSALSPRSVEAAKKKPKKKNPKPPALKSAFTCSPPLDDVFEASVISRYAQSFTATRGGSLREIRVRINKLVNDRDYIVQLVRMSGAVPSASTLDVLAAATIPDTEVPTGNATLVAKFAATNLVQGTQYAVVVSQPGSEIAIPVPLNGNACAGDFSQAVADGDFVNENDPARDMTVSVLVA